QEKLTERIPDHTTHDQRRKQQGNEYFAIAGHHVPHRRRRRGNRNLEWRQQGLSHSYLADSRGLYGISMLTGKVGDRLSAKVAGPEKAVGHRAVHVDIEQ